MNKSSGIIFVVILIVAMMTACKGKRSGTLDSLSSLESLKNSAYTVRLDSIRHLIRTYMLAERDTTVCDSVLTIHYWKDNELFWLDDISSNRIDSMLYWLENVSRHGIRPELFPTCIIKEQLQRIRSLKLEEGETLNKLLASIEYRLTKSYLTYVSGLKFGFLPPEYKWPDSISSLRLKRCDKLFVKQALEILHTNPYSAFHWAQPRTSLYLHMQKELESIEALTRTDSLEQCRNALLVNLERARWQYVQDKGKKYVEVNVAAFMLQAVDAVADTLLEMRVCCGSEKNKTPLLDSRISYMELNPYWNVPQSIIKKEIIPSYRKDTTYFTRNHMKVYNKEGVQINPHAIKWSNYVDAIVPYAIKQDNKEGNSLGRIIFRFPNKYDVYLHDTPSRSAFNRTSRAISHGCIRLQDALGFSFFLLKKPDELLEDRIRIAMDIPPVSDKGKKLMKSEAYRELKHYSLPERIPLFIDYKTVYLSSKGKLSYCKDVYHYDAALLSNLEYFKLKP